MTRIESAEVGWRLCQVRAGEFSALMMDINMVRPYSPLLFFEGRSIQLVEPAHFADRRSAEMADQFMRVKADDHQLRNTKINAQDRWVIGFHPRIGDQLIRNAVRQNKSAPDSTECAGGTGEHQLH